MKSKLPVETLLFDFDGVLVDSIPVKTKAFARLFAPFGTEIVSQITAHHEANGGMPRREKIHYYYKSYLNRPLSEGHLSQLCDQFSELVVEEVIFAPEISGAGAFLRRWHQTVDCHVVTASPEAEVVTIITRRGWHSFFRSIGGIPKTKSQCIAQILAGRHLSGHQAILFGDSQADLEAAETNRVHLVAVAGSADAALASCSKALFCISDFTDSYLEKWMQAHLGPPVIN